MEKLNAFTRKYSDARNWIETWVSVVQEAGWKNPKELKDRYPDASILANNEIYFNVKGSHYRLKVKIAYNTGILLIQWVGTHKEYTRRLKEGK